MIGGRSLFLLALLAFGLAFLYAPLAHLVAQSFNGAELSGLWGGVSLRWYRALGGDRQLLGAAGLSLGLGLAVATLATLLGTLAGLALGRGGRFRGRWLFALLLTAPLVLPQVVSGLALLLHFVELQRWSGWPAGRGFDTVMLAQATFAMTFVAVVVRARLVQLDPDLEAAAADLGARPLPAFLLVTLPQLWPALLAGWLLAFTLSLDDLLIASFVSGPGATTLPMAIFARVRLGLSPEVNALATLLLVLAAVLVALAVRLMTSRTSSRRAAGG